MTAKGFHLPETCSMTLTNSLRVLVVHSTYQQRGGEESVMGSEVALLRAYGHTVEVYSRDNTEVYHMGKATLALQTLWSRRTSDEVGGRIENFRPDIVHVHNTLPLVSPSVYWAAGKRGVPVVQTLHNFRLLCPQAMLLRNGHVCEDCLGTWPWRSVLRRCYRNSASQTAVLAGTLTWHRFIGTFSRKVTRYIATDEHSRRKFIQGGLPPDKVVTKPHFVDLVSPTDEPRSGGLFVGRLSPEKGISVLVEALASAAECDFAVIGTGPDQSKIISSKARYLGYLDATRVYERMQHASYLVLPSLWYENSPRTLIESFACGLPVIASRLGSMAELIEEGVTGLLFEPGSADDLASKIRWAERHSDRMAQMGRNARTEYELKYTPEINYHRLVEIYAQALTESGSVMTQ